MKAAVVGLGIGMAHAAGYLESPDAELYAVCDLLPHRLQRVGGTFDSGSMLCLKPLFDEALLTKTWQEIGVKIFTDIDLLLADPEVELVSICTPDFLHAEHAEKVLKAGKHLLLEKPADIDLDAAKRIRTAIQDSGCRFGLGYEFRVNPAIEKLRELRISGVIGEVRAISLHHFRTPFKRDKWNNWIQQRVFSGGLIVEETCHWIDLVRFLSGKEIDSIQCTADSGILPETDFEDAVFINGTYREGGVFQIAHILTGFDFDLKIAVHGSQGTLWCALKDEPYSVLDNGETSYCGLVVAGQPGMAREKVQRWTWGLEATEPWNIRELVKRVAESAAKGVEPPAGIQDGIESLRWAIKARECTI